MISAGKCIAERFMRGVHGGIDHRHARSTCHAKTLRNSAAVSALPKTGVPTSNSFACERTHHHRLEARVLHQAHRDWSAAASSAASGIAILFAGAMRLALQRRYADRVEGAHQTRARQELGRRDTGSFCTRGDRHVAVACRDRVRRVENDLALDRVSQIAPELRQRASRVPKPAARRRRPPPAPACRRARRTRGAPPAPYRARGRATRT